MNPHHRGATTSSTLSSITRARNSIILKYFSPDFDKILTSISDRARRIGRIFPRLVPLRFREKTKLTWASEVRGGVGAKDFVVVILAQYRGWKMAGKEKDHNLQLNTVLKDGQLLLESLGYERGDESRRWYFVTDFDIIYTDANGVETVVPRATLPGTETLALPTKEGILRILEEATSEGGSGFVHCGVHCFYETTGTSRITKAGGEIRYIETPDESDVKEAFIVGTDGERLHGRDFLASLSDNSEKRCGTTLTLSFDMCNAAAFLDGVVKLPCLHRSPDFEGSRNDPAAISKTTNQLVVISASQAGQPAVEYLKCGAMTYLLAEALQNEQVETAADVIKFIHDRCQTQPNKDLLQTPQIAARYSLAGRFWLLPDRQSML